MRDDTPIWQLTVGELKSILKNDAPVVKDNKKKLVYGLTGIAELFNCSTSTAHRIKKSGKIDKAISQVGRKIVVDADLALKLHNR